MKCVKRLKIDPQEMSNTAINEKDKPNFNAPHPLLIPHIIETTFTYLFSTGGELDFKRNLCDWKNARLVCSRWNEVAARLHRKHGEDLVFGEAYAAGTPKMRKFLKDMEACWDCPFQTFRFDPGFFIQKNEPLFKTFLFSCSGWITKLKLWFDNQSDLKFQKRCYPNLKLEGLEYLFFGCVNYRGTCSHERMELTYVLDALLRAASNLKTLCFSFPPKDIRSQQSLITRFGDLICTKCPKSVRNLKLEMKLTNEQFLALIGLRLCLDSLNCDFRGSVLKASVLRKLFEQQRTCLQEMRLLDSEFKYGYELEFPRFEKLTMFEIQGGVIKEFGYKESFPVLERLMLFGWENEKTSRSMLESCSPCESLKSLELPYRIQDKGMIGLAAKCFPNLKKLEITPTHQGMDVLTTVFAKLTQLEELEITFPFIIDVELNVDPVFTGISVEDCEQMSNTRNAGKALKELNVERLQKSPSVANLSRLRKLTILDHSSEIRLTDVTALFGLMRLASLKVLEMSRFHISDEIFQDLKKRVLVCENYDSEDSSSCTLSDFCDSSSDEDFLDAEFLSDFDFE